MDLAGFNIQVGKLFALKVVVGKERSHDDRNKYYDIKKDSYRTDYSPYSGIHSPPELANDHMLTYNSRGATSIPGIPPGSRLKVYI
jgi:hypothetical protein